MATKNEILNAVDQIKEYLALNKTQDAIKLMAQVSVAIIENLTDEALIVSKGYEQDLKALENGGIVNDSTAHNLETLIISGVQANNGVNVPKDYVDKAFEVLNDEIDIIYNKQQKTEFGMPAQQTNIVDDNKPMYNEMGSEEEEPVFLNTNGDVDFRKKEKYRKYQLSRALLKNKRKISKLLAIIIPIVAIIALTVVAKVVFFSHDDKPRREETYEYVEPSSEETTEETEPETTSYWTGTFIVTGDIVWIRDQANTSSSKKLESRNKGDVVNVVGEYDDSWAIISYEGKEAFMAKEYLSPQR